MRNSGSQVTVLCEGPNDAALIKKMTDFFCDAGFDVRPRPRQGINALIVSAGFLIRKYTVRGPVILLFDHGDLRKEDLKKIKSLKERNGAVMLVPAVQKIEAWLMADTEALYRATGSVYRGPLPTDHIEDPKDYFLHFFRVSVRQKKRSFLSKETDFFRAVVWRWDFKKARKNNRSLDSFCNRFEKKFC